MERPAGEADVYVARTAALVIHPDKITAVVVTREPVYADSASITESLRRRLGLPGQPQPIRVTGYYYMATFHVDAHAARKIHTLTGQNVGQIQRILGQMFAGRWGRDVPRAAAWGQSGRS